MPGKLDAFIRAAGLDPVSQDMDPVDRFIEGAGSVEADALRNLDRMSESGILREEQASEDDARLRSRLGRLGWLAPEVSGAMRSISSTQQALGLGSPSEQEDAESTAESVQIANPGLLTSIRQGAGGVAADLPLMLAGGPLAAPVRGVKALASLPKLRAALEVGAAVQPLALREGAVAARQNGIGSGLANWTIETAIPSMFGKTGAERVILGAGKEHGVRMIRDRLMTLAKDAGWEGSEEVVTELGHAVWEAMSGEDPNALDTATLARRLTVAGAVGGLMGAGFAGAELSSDELAKQLHLRTAQREDDALYREMLPELQRQSMTDLVSEVPDMPRQVRPELRDTDATLRQADVDKLAAIKARLAEQLADEEAQRAGGSPQGVSADVDTGPVARQPVPVEEVANPPPAALERTLRKKPISYEEYKAQMLALLKAGEKYQGQAGEAFISSAMADLEQEHPEHAQRLDEESNALPATAPNDIRSTSETPSGVTDWRNGGSAFAKVSMAPKIPDIQTMKPEDQELLGDSAVEVLRREAQRPKKKKNDKPPKVVSKAKAILKTLGRQGEVTPKPATPAEGQATLDEQLASKPVLKPTTPAVEPGSVTEASIDLSRAVAERPDVQNALKNTPSTANATIERAIGEEYGKFGMLKLPSDPGRVKAWEQVIKDHRADPSIHALGARVRGFVKKAQDATPGTEAKPGNKNDLGRMDQGQKIGQADQASVAGVSIRAGEGDENETIKDESDVSTSNNEWTLPPGYAVGYRWNIADPERPSWNSAENRPEAGISMLRSVSLDNDTHDTGGWFHSGKLHFYTGKLLKEKGSDGEPLYEVGSIREINRKTFESLAAAAGAINGEAWRKTTLVKITTEQAGLGRSDPVFYFSDGTKLKSEWHSLVNFGLTPDQIETIHNNTKETSGWPNYERQWNGNFLVRVNNVGSKDVVQIKSKKKKHAEQPPASVRPESTRPESERPAAAPAMPDRTAQDLPHDAAPGAPKSSPGAEEAPPTQPVDMPAPVVRNPQDQVTRTIAAAEALADALDEAGQALNWQKLFRICDQAFGGTQGQGAYKVQDAYEALQLAVNKVIARHPHLASPTADSPAEGLKFMADLERDLPTQTARTGEQISHQQFSTPPSYAFMANWVANLRPGEVYLEPSVGTGSLAVFGRMAGDRVLGNELSERRAKLAETLGIEMTTENADHLAAIYSAQGKPQPGVVVMNPPFSATAGRTDKRDLLTGARHIEQAFQLLPPGGRLVAIVGEGMAFNAKAYREWWATLGRQAHVRANIEVPGTVYHKYGTTFGTRLLVIDKPAEGETPLGTQAAVTGTVASLAELGTLLKGVRDGRQAPVQAARNPEPPPAQSGGPGDSGEGQEDGAAGKPGSGEPGGGSPGAVSGTVPPVSGDRRPGPRRNRLPGQRSEPESQGSDGGPGGRGSAGTVADGSGKRGDLPAGHVEQPGHGSVRVEQADSGPVEDQGETYATYKPSLAILGTKPHPAELVESQAMASVKAPRVTYEPRLDQKVITEGRLSDAQLEQLVRAGAAMENLLPNGQRQGYFIGDGTGVGKGRTIAGVILDQANHGRKRAVWVSMKPGLIADAQRDWTGLGGKAEDLFAIKNVKATGKIPPRNGIAFISYKTLATKSGAQDALANADHGKEVKPGGRIQQLVEWLGKDFDGVIAFDEAHNMGNAVAIKGRRGVKKPSQMALAGLLLQQSLPKARVLYVSATGATEVSNLAYATRLGLWGDGTAFADAKAFINDIAASGLAGMELVARDLKATGRYLARSISFRGVGYERLTHNLTEDQTAIYNELAKAWQVVLRNIWAALESTRQGKNRDARKNAIGAFWNAHQRFFNQVLTGMQMPAVIQSMQADLERGDAPVVQLVNTNEAATKRALQAREAKQAEEDDDEDDLSSLDLTPREMLMQAVKNGFPTVQYQEVTDKNGNTTSEPVKDSKGNLVENPQAVAMRNQLLKNLADIRTPDGPMEQILAAFGPDQVAEVSGRTVRVVGKKQADGSWKTVQEKRSQAKAMKEAAEFQDDKRKILIFSAAGGTGFSFHADRKAKNQRPRRHYVLQPGWRADSALQGLGRSHRTNQAQPPTFILTSTDLRAQKRFISTIARRLDQLGALTKGQRQAGSGGLFSAADNLESDAAETALDWFTKDLAYGKIPGVSVAEFEAETGLAIRDGASGKVETPEMRQFLNRMLSLSTDMQNQVFDAFQERLDKTIEIQKANGTLDVGLETLKADKIEETGQQVVHTDAKSGATTIRHDLQVSKRNKTIDFDQALANGRNWSRSGEVSFVRHERSNRVWILSSSDRTKTDKQGRIETTYSKIGINGFSDLLPRSEFGKYRQIDEETARSLWSDELAKAPEFRVEAMHLFSGALLPVWDRLPSTDVRAMRATLQDGRSILGRVIQPYQIDQVMQDLGVADANAKILAPAEVMQAVENGQTAVLRNGWKIKRVRFGGEMRAEITGKSSSRELDTWRGSLENAGVDAVYKEWNYRYFLPFGQPAVWERILADRPLARLGEPEENEDQPVQEAPHRIPGEDATGRKPKEVAALAAAERQSRRQAADPDAPTRQIVKKDLPGRMEGIREGRRFKRVVLVEGDGMRVDPLTGVVSIGSKVADAAQAQDLASALREAERISGEALAKVPDDLRLEIEGEGYRVAKALAGELGEDLAALRRVLRCLGG